MQKTLFVHIGVHKTGTTAIQTHYALYAPLFRCFGLNYPRLGSGFRYRNQDIAEDIRRSTPGGEFKTVASYLTRITKSKLPKHLLSAEALFALPRGPEYFDHFSKIARVRIIFFVRRQDRYLESIYRQMVKNESTASTANFFHFAKSRIQPSESTKRVDWFDRLQPWAERFGHENITVIPYPEYQRLDSVNSLANVIGIPVAKRLPRFDLGDNLSLSCETIEFLRRIRKEGLKYVPKKLGALDRLVENPSSAYLPLERRKSMVERFEESNSSVGKHFRCDISAMTSFDNEIESARTLFQLEAFNFEQMRALAERCGLLV